MSAVQAVIFNKHIWTKNKAQRELRKLGIIPIKEVHETANYLRYRIADPKDFNRFVIRETSKDFKFVIGYY